MGKRFGFDLGVTSVGWSVFEAEGNTVIRLLDAGSRVFDEPRQPKSKESNAVARRKARAARRQIRRRATRRKLMIGLFKKYGWLDGSMAPPYGFSNNPYLLRKEALERLLSPLELSEVLFNLAKRRGFKSNRKLDRVSKESNETTEAANRISVEMNDKGHRTLGEHLHFLYSNDPHTRIRCKKTLRQMYLDEFMLISQMQQKLGSRLLNEDRTAELQKVVFFQLPFELQDERRLRMIGKCSLEVTARRAYRYDPIAIEFRIRKTVNDLRLIDPRTYDARSLSRDEREASVMALLESPKLSFSKLKRLIGALDTHRFNFETERTDEIKGDPYYSAVVKVLKKRYRPDFKADIQEICSVLHEAESFEAADTLLRSKSRDIVLSKDELTDLDKIFPLGEDGTSAYSVEAMKKLMPLLEKGMDEYKAIADLYPSKEMTKTSDLLPLPTEKITNPSVNCTVHQFRRVYNALVKLYGKPDSVVIELAKEIKKSKKQQIEESKSQKSNENRRKLFAQQIKEAKLEPSRDLVLRLELAESQGYVCPYTGKSFGHAEIFAEGLLEVDHILPFSRSLDDSKTNLVLVDSKANLDKGNRTPGEWKKGADYEQMIERIAQMKLSYLKKSRFYTNAQADIDTFISQQLNDTRYASKFVREFVGKTFQPSERRKKVLSIRGSHTGWLRKLLGLNHLLSDSSEKNRNDLRHHAVDAVVVGLSNSKLLQMLAKARGSYGSHFQLPEICPNLHQDIKRILDTMIVSRKQSRKLSGALHKATSYSPSKESHRKGWRVVAQRIDLTKITLTQTNNIIDPVIKSLVLARLMELGYDGNDKSVGEALLKNKALSGLTMKSGVPIKKVRIAENVGEKTIQTHRDPHSGKIYRTVLNDGNHALSILPPDPVAKKGSVVITSMLSAIRRETPKNALMTLHKGDCVTVDGFGLGYVRNLSLTQSGGPYIEIGLDRAAKAEEKDVDFKRFTSLDSLQNGVKPVAVSVIGKLE